MKRTQIQVDEETYRRLKEEAHARGASMAALVREALRAYLGLAPKGKKPSKTSPSSAQVPQTRGISNPFPNAMMRPWEQLIFLDTSAIYALADAADPNHQRAKELFGKGRGIPCA